MSLFLFTAFVPVVPHKWCVVCGTMFVCVCVVRVKVRLGPNWACFFLSPTVSDDSEEWACEDETISFCNESVRLRFALKQDIL